MSKKLMLILIVDDTPTNLAVVSGVLKELIQDESGDQWRKSSGHRHRA